jgi:hypothetical protein
MTLTVDLTSEEEARLSREAAERGLEISEYARRLLTEQLSAIARTENGDESTGKVPFYRRTSAQEWSRALDQWSQSHSTTTPLISDEKLQRENMYEERD